MGRKRTILFTKLTAGFFLALVLFIHVAKLVHHHSSYQAVSKFTHAGKHIVSNTDCSVCDYYFIKDSHNGTAHIHLTAPFSVSVFFNDYLSQRLTSIGLSSSDRGPPASV